MAKYIIDIPDDTSYVNIVKLSGGCVSKVKTVYIPELTPYIEPDRKQIENEVWEFASLLMNMHPDVAEHVYWSMNGGKGIGVAAEMTYQQAKAKYEAWKQDRGQIKVGDEVEYTCCKETVRFVVVGVVGDTAYGFKYPCDYDDVGEYCALDQLRKTGRHFTEVDELLKKMRGESMKEDMNVEDLLKVIHDTAIGRSATFPKGWIRIEDFIEVLKKMRGTNDSKVS